jgi:hypothetical protein
MQIINNLCEHIITVWKGNEQTLMWIIGLFFTGGAVAIYRIIFKKKELIEITRCKRENDSFILEIYHKGKMLKENITIGLELKFFHFEFIFGSVTNAINNVTLIKSDEKSEHLLHIFCPCRKVNITFTPFNPNDRYYLMYKTNRNEEKPKISNNKSMIIKEIECNKNDKKRIERNFRFQADNILYEENSRLTKLSEICFKDKPELISAGTEYFKIMEDALEIARIKINHEQTKTDIK